MINEVSRWNKTNRKKRSKEIVSRTEKKAVSISKAEIITYNQFFRGEHPDTRTNSQFLRDLGAKQSDKKKRKVGPTGMEIKCLNNGKTYGTLREAVDDLGIGHSNLSKHLRGHRAYSHVGGMKFQYV